MSGQSAKAKRKPLLIGGAALAVVVVGGWLVASHIATKTAKDKVDTFLIRNNLTGVVSYGGISASPFGSATLSHVLVRDSSGAAVAKFGSVEISDLRVKDGAVLGAKVSLASAAIPLLPMARQNPGDATLAGLVGLGYTTLTGNLSVAEHFNAERGRFSLNIRSDIDGMGRLKLRLKLNDIDPGMMDVVAKMAQAGAQGNGLAILGTGLAGLQSLESTSLDKLTVTIDDSKLVHRLRKIPVTAIPAKAGPSMELAPGLNVDQLVRAGMSLSDARNTADAVRHWSRNGGTIHMRTHIASPLPLFKSTGVFGGAGLAFSNVDTFLAATRATISN